MDFCDYSIDILIVRLKELIGRTNFGNEHTAAEKITQTMKDCKFSCQNKYGPLQRIGD